MWAKMGSSKYAQCANPNSNLWMFEQKKNRGLYRRRVIDTPNFQKQSIMAILGNFDDILADIAPTKSLMTGLTMRIYSRGHYGDADIWFITIGLKFVKWHCATLLLAEPMLFLWYLQFFNSRLPTIIYPVSASFSSIYSIGATLWLFVGLLWGSL